MCIGMANGGKQVANDGKTIDHIADDGKKIFTDKEIIKASKLVDKLRNAYNDYYDISKCMPYDIDTTLRESAICLENTLNEINRQQAENERLNNELHSKVEYIHEQLEIIERKKAEIERLNVELVGMRGACNSYKMHYDNAIVENEELRAINESLERDRPFIKAEAIKEFAERLKNSFDDFYHTEEDALLETDDLIDNLVKEMVGEGK